MRRGVAGLLAAAGLLVAAPSRPAESPGWAVAVFPSGAEFALELALDPEARAHGYMERERVGPREGMLFVFEASGRHAFWMKQCRVPLDIVWLDESMRVLEIAPNQQPCPTEGPCPGVLPMRAARYVLEVAAGIAAEQRLVAGSRVTVVADRVLP